MNALHAVGNEVNDLLGGVGDARVDRLGDAPGDAPDGARLDPVRVS